MRDAAPDAPERVVLESDEPSVELALPQALAVTALRNLLDNALRYAPAQHSVRLEIQSAQDTVCFRVCDSGPGLSADELTRVTQRFWRRDTGRGSGLGLAVVHRAADDDRGFVEGRQDELRGAERIRGTADRQRGQRRSAAQ